MIRFATALLCIALFALAGCKGDKKSAAAPIAAPTDPAGQPGPGPAADDEPAVAVTEAALDELDLKTTADPETVFSDDQNPTPADYEEEAAKKITAANMESELEALESELSH